MSPMQRHLYPPDWPATARRIKEAAGWRCMECGKQCRRPGEPFDGQVRTLTVHHVNFDQRDCADSNLVALCPACHLRADGQHHARNARRTRDAQRGQLTLWRDAT